MIQALLAFIAALVVALGGALYMVRSSAADATEARLEAASQAAINASQQATAKVTDVSTTKLAQARTRIYTEIKEVIREVPVLIPAGSCDLPPGFRVLHDAAAGGPLPAAASGPDAAPVPAQVAAGAVAENYGTCRETAAQLEGLQEWVRGVSK